MAEACRLLYGDLEGSLEMKLLYRYSWPQNQQSEPEVAAFRPNSAVQGVPQPEMRLLFRWLQQRLDAALLGKVGSQEAEDLKTLEAGEPLAAAGVHKMLRATAC